MAVAGRMFERALRGLYAVLALGLVLAALYVSLGRALVPLVAEYRGELETRASAALGQRLRIGALEGRWRGFAPQLELRDVRLENDGETLQLDRLRVVPDVLASLRSASLRIASLEVHGLQLAVQEEADGSWRVKGVRRSSAPLDPAQIFALLQTPRQLALLDSRLSVQPRDGELLGFNYVGLSLDNRGAGQRLDGRLLLPDGQPLSWQLRAELRPEAWREARGQLYLSLPQSDWAAWLAQRLPDAWQLRQLQAGGEVWLDWAPDGVQRAAARLHAPQLVLGHASKAPVSLSDLLLTGYFEREADGWRLLVEDVAGNYGAVRLNPGRLLLRQQGGEQRWWSVQAERLNLAPLAQLTLALAPLPAVGEDVLATMAPHGRLRNLSAEIRPRSEGLPEVSYSAGLDRVGFKAWHNVPAADNITGTFSGSLEGGELRMDTTDFMLHLAFLFPEPWHYRSARARLVWRLDGEAFTLYSHLMQLSGEEGEIAGNMMIRLLHDPAAEDYMDLQVGMHKGQSRYTPRYLPTLSPGLSPQLADWLKTSIGEGQVDEGMFIYQGSLNKGSPEHSRALELFFKVHDAELAYQPQWPPLRQLQGEVFVEPERVRIQASAAQVLDSRVENVKVNIPLNTGKAPHLYVDGLVHSSMGDGLKILQDTPLGRSNTFAGWRGEGALEGHLQLDIPLAANAGPVGAVVDFRADGARLQLSQPALDLQGIVGAFRYDSARGLSGRDIVARAFDRPLRANISAEGQGGKPLTRLDVSSSIAVPRLIAWLGEDPAQIPASGELPYRLWLDIDGEASRLRVSSDLQGAVIDLPTPLGKTAEETRSASWRMNLGGSERRYELGYAGLASLAFVAPAGQLGNGRGELRLGGEAAQVPQTLGLHVRGALDAFDWPAWRAVLERPAGDKQKAALGSLLQSVDLDIGRFTSGSLALDQLHAGVQRVGQGWRLQLGGPQLVGEVVVPGGEAPLRIELERLRLPARDPQAPPGDPLAQIDPLELPAMDVTVHSFFIGAERFGRGRFRSRPTAAGAHFDQLDLDLRGLHLDGTLDWEGRDAQARSRYRGRLSGGDLAEVLPAWGFAPSMSSRDFRVDVDGGWPGSPANGGLRHFDGSLSARARQGKLVEVEGGASALRVFGLLNFNALGRRLRMDFSDLFGKGLSYDNIRGQLAGSDGQLLTQQPLVLEGPSSRLELDGKLDMPEDRIDAKLKVTLPLSNNLPLAALLAGAPPVAGALFIVDRLIGDRLSRVASVDYHVEGSLLDPQISLTGKSSGAAR